MKTVVVTGRNVDIEHLKIKVARYSNSSSQWPEGRPLTITTSTRYVNEGMVYDFVLAILTRICYQRKRSCDFRGYTVGSTKWNYHAFSSNNSVKQMFTISLQPIL